ncbi:transcriptional regulator [Actinopolyspora erythraea]|uniref:DNA-binding protein n=1 Tax=Actinopolyspora erythraea TaxID=414996 RepID=A0A099D1T8_9ACTN|nr:helix-turn-helix transcriptional regulator [Actinopolyspora erythraea]ASU78021.1 transcriptional regulator [Actinopolyspora erythraea]KGI79787.1 DNA-binding protein [Actinopolyspora erythraea]
MPLGARIRQFRDGVMTQQDLATAAGVSVDLVRKLEQGRRNTASVASLHQIARALDVPLGDLIGPVRMPEQAPAEGVAALRFAVADVDDLTGESEAGEPLSLSEAEQELTYLWGTYWSGKYDRLTALLPPALTSLRATTRATGSPRASELVAQGFWAAGSTLIHLHQSDAAYIALRHAIELAGYGNDQLLAAALRGSIAWQLLTVGRFAESEAVALRMAERIEPSGERSFPQLSTYGSLIVTAATAAARGGNRAQARSLIDTSAEVAHRIGRDRDDYNSAFGPSQVAMQSVDVNVQTGEYGQALESARTMPHHHAAGLPLAARARHLTDRALAHSRLGHHEQASTLVLTAEQMAPEWAKRQQLLKSVTRDLLRGSRTRAPRLRNLADRLNVT